MKWPRDPEARRRLVDALLTWVEELDRVEPLPSGIDSEVRADLPDLRTTVSALLALRNEVAVQGRAFSRLADASRMTRDDAQKTAREEDRERSRRDRAEGRREVLSHLLDARDRIARTLGIFERQASLLTGGFPGARRRREAVAGLLPGLRMNLEATDEALRGLDCREIPAEGRPFDARVMRAVEAAGPEEGESGAVVSVLRSGWFAGSEILRPAEVRATATTTKMSGTTPGGTE